MKSSVTQHGASSTDNLQHLHTSAATAARNSASSQASSQVTNAASTTKEAQPATLASITRDVREIAQLARRIMSGPVRSLSETMTSVTAVNAKGAGPIVVSDVCAIITVERDARFFKQTLESVLSQSVLPSQIVIACQTGENLTSLAAYRPARAQAHVGAQAGAQAPADAQAQASPQAQADSSIATATADYISVGPVQITVLPLEGAKSFGDAISQVLRAQVVDPSIARLWLLHDDSRAADSTTLFRMVNADAKQPGVQLWGAKQLDWKGETLHDVGSFTDRWNRRASLVVDGEEDQGQYDRRLNVYSVSLAGALVHLTAWNKVRGTRPWYGFDESVDLSRRMWRAGFQVGVVPQARIAHRRARFDGIRNLRGQALTHPRSSVWQQVIARDKIRISATPLLLAPFAWLGSIIVSLFLFLGLLFSKKPWQAVCELLAPWAALVRTPVGLYQRTQLRLAGQGGSHFTALRATSSQLHDWHTRQRIFRDAQSRPARNPLEAMHLKTLARRRLRWEFALAIVGIVATALVNRSSLAALFSGNSLSSVWWPATSASTAHILHVASTPWTYSLGMGAAAAPLPFAWDLLVISLLGGGHLAIGLTVFWLLAPAGAMLMMFALAGTVSRSNAVRFSAGLLWGALLLATGIVFTGDVAMLMVWLMLPAILYSLLRAIGFYAVDQPKKAHSSVQFAAIAGLCCAAAVLAQPQLLLVFLLLVLVFLVLARSHRLMVLLLPVPAVVMSAPTWLSALGLAELTGLSSQQLPLSSSFAQLFGSALLPYTRTQLFAHPPVALFTVMDGFAAGLGSTSSWSAFLKIVIALVAILSCIVLAMAVISLFVTRSLRLSRLSWMLMLLGSALAAFSATQTIGVTTDVLALQRAGSGSVSPFVQGSVLPGLSVLLLGLVLAAICVAGVRDHTFVGLLEVDTATGDEVDVSSRAGGSSVASRASVLPQHGLVPDLLKQMSLTQSELSARYASTVEDARRKQRPVRILHSLISTVLVVTALSLTLVSAVQAGMLNKVSTTGSLLPLVGVADLQEHPRQRVLALRVADESSVQYTVMSSAAGDVLDRNVNADVIAAHRSNAEQEKLNSLAANLLSENAPQALAQLEKLGFIGIFVVPSHSTDAGVVQAHAMLASHVAGSDQSNTVVNNQAGLYVRLLSSTTQSVDGAQSFNTVEVPVTGEARASRSPLRIVWLIAIAVLVVVWLLLALPKRRSVKE